MASYMTNTEALAYYVKILTTTELQTTDEFGEASDVANTRVEEEGIRFNEDGLLIWAGFFAGAFDEDKAVQELQSWQDQWGR